LRCKGCDSIGCDSHIPKDRLKAVCVKDPKAIARASTRFPAWSISNGVVVLTRWMFSLAANNQAEHEKQQNDNRALVQSLARRLRWFSAESRHILNITFWTSVGINRSFDLRIAVIR